MSLPRNTKQDVKVDIKEGDTIWDLSQKLGVDVGAASGYKSGDPNLIYPGEQLTFKDVSLDKYAQFAEDRLKSAGMDNPEHSVPDMLKENADAAKKNMEDKIQQSQQSSQSQASNQSAADNKAKAQRERADSKAAQLNDTTKSHDVAAANADKAAKEKALKDAQAGASVSGQAQHGSASQMPGSHGAVDMDAAKKSMSDAAKAEQNKKAAKEQSVSKDNKTKSTNENVPQTNADKFKSALSADNDEYRSWAQSRELDPRMFKYRYESDPQGVTKQYADDFGNYSKQYQQEHAKAEASPKSVDKPKYTGKEAQKPQVKQNLKPDSIHPTDKDRIQQQGNYTGVILGDARNRAASFASPAADHADTKAMAAVAGMSAASKGISQSNHQAKETAEQNLKKPIQDAADKAIHKMNEKIAKKNVFQMSADMNRGNDSKAREREGSAERLRSQHLQDAMQHMMGGMALGNDSREMSA